MILDTDKEMIGIVRTAAMVVTAVIAGLFLLLFYSFPAKADCGLIKPVAPLMCSVDNAVCLCEPSGDCHWVYVGCR